MNTLIITKVKNGFVIMDKPNDPFLIADQYVFNLLADAFDFIEEYFDKSTGTET